MSPPRRQLLRYEHNTDCAKLGPADDVVCCHNLGQRASQRDAFIASKPDLLQVRPDAISLANIIPTQKSDSSAKQ